MGIAEIERAIEQLPPEDLAQFAEWFEEFMAQAWDKQIEEDVQAGRLDALIREAEQEYEAGHTRPM
ncbi:MAG: hypothetical protein U0822_06905 [Anaerolineae bacterium]